MVYFKKTQPAPASLIIEKAKGIAHGNYRLADVLALAIADFHDKCYICESNNVASINVEHFDPHENTDIDKKFDWNNLFWSCAHCNGIKSNTHINLLNCTVLSEKVDTKIKYDTNFTAPIPKDKVVIEAIDRSIQTINTVTLLQLVYTGECDDPTINDVTDMRKYQAGAIREELFNELSFFHDHLYRYFTTRNLAQKDLRKSYIIHALNNSSPFTAFKRYIVNNDAEYFHEFGNYIVN